MQTHLEDRSVEGHAVIVLVYCCLRLDYPPNTHALLQKHMIQCWHGSSQMVT